MIGRNIKCKVFKDDKTEISVIRWAHAIVGNTVSIKINDFDEFGFSGFKIDGGWLVVETHVDSDVTTVLRAA